MRSTIVYFFFVLPIGQYFGSQNEPSFYILVEDEIILNSKDKLQKMVSRLSHLKANGLHTARIVSEQPIDSKKVEKLNGVTLKSTPTDLSVEQFGEFKKITFRDQFEVVTDTE